MPVLCVVGQGQYRPASQEPFQCVDMPDIVKTVTKKACAMKAEDLPAIMNEAFYLMRGVQARYWWSFLMYRRRSWILTSTAMPREVPQLPPGHGPIKQAVQMIKESKAGPHHGRRMPDRRLHGPVVKLAEMLQIPGGYHLPGQSCHGYRRTIR